MALYAGIGWFPGKSEGCTGTYQEPGCDGQDPKADQCRNCPDEVNLMEDSSSCEKAIGYYSYCDFDLILE